MLITGCRPKEAAYLVRANSLQKNDYPDFKDCDWKATMPAELTKTRLNYKWPIPRDMNVVVGILRALHQLAPDLESELGDLDKFTKAIDHWFLRRVLRDAEREKRGVTVRSPGGPCHNFRSVRAWHGSQWAMAAALARKEGKEPPFNPLQHTNNKTILRHYAVDPPDAVEAGREKERRRVTKRREKQEAAVKRHT